MRYSYKDYKAEKETLAMKSLSQSVGDTLDPNLEGGSPWNIDLMSIEEMQ